MDSLAKVIALGGRRLNRALAMHYLFGNTVKELPNCLNFLGNEDFILKTSNASKSWNGALEYSTDGETWTVWDGTEISSARKVLYLRGTGNTKITGSSSDNRFVLSGANTLKVACRGNIENLLDYETVTSGGHPTVDGYCFYYMFNGCTQLTEAPDMPTTLTNAGYACAYMFQNCTSLTKAPKLPATTMAMACYQGMFKDCTSLTKAPELPAITLANYCYSEMFQNCASLTTAPELPATKLYEHCYASMFSGCTSLTEAPALPATQLGTFCYNYIFNNCTSLTTAPELPATTLVDNCYRSMFQNCTSLTEAPALPATKMANYCYYYMFNGCKSLTTAPELPAITLANHCCRGMFLNCASLEVIPKLPATNLYYYCYGNMFYGCKKIKLSTTQTGDYQTEYRIPTSGTGVTATGVTKDMFSNTGGTFTGTPDINTTYYTSNNVV